MTLLARLQAIFSALGLIIPKESALPIAVKDDFRLAFKNTPTALRRVI